MHSPRVYFNNIGSICTYSLRNGNGLFTLLLLTRAAKSSAAKSSATKTRSMESGLKMSSPHLVCLIRLSHGFCHGWPSLPKVHNYYVLVSSYWGLHVHFTHCLGQTHSVLCVYLGAHLTRVISTVLFALVVFLVYGSKDRTSKGWMSKECNHDCVMEMTKFQ